MANVTKENFHSKMEKIALRFLSLNNKRTNTNEDLMNNVNYYIMKNDSGQLFNKETKEDSLTVYLKSKNNKSLSKKENYIDKFTKYYSIESVDKIKEKRKSKIPKENTVVPKIKGLEEIAQNYIDKLNKKRKESIYSSVIENSSEYLNNDIDYEILDKIYLIYEELMKEFDNIHNMNYNNKECVIKEREDILKKIYFKCIVLGRDYYKVFLFGKEIEKIIKIFKYSSEIGKFILNQIYLFLSLIYLNENEHIDNTIEMSYRALILYSSQNFKTLIELIQNPYLSSEPKIMNNIKAKNKIIISVLKLINPNIAAKDKIKKFINKEESNINDMDKFSIKFFEEMYQNKDNHDYNFDKIKMKSKYNSDGIINIILLLKQNKELEKRLIEIQKKVFTISLNNYEKNQNYSKSLNNSGKSNNIFKNNEHNQEENYKSDFISSINKDLNNNADNKGKNFSNTNNNQINYSFGNDKIILPNISDESKNYKFYVFFELDETLVHYWEENDESFVKLRWGVEDCLSQISEFCEITLVSTSSQEYTEKILERLNKNGKYITNIIYKEENDDKLNLSLINREMNKCIFICHEEEFFNAPKNNILTLTEFQGDENDREILFLCKEIMRLKNQDINDISQIIPEMINNIKI